MEMTRILFKRGFLETKEEKGKVMVFFFFLEGASFRRKKEKEKGRRD